MKREQNWNDVFLFAGSSYEMHCRVLHDTIWNFCRCESGTPYITEFPKSRHDITRACMIVLQAIVEIDGLIWVMLES